MTRLARLAALALPLAGLAGLWFQSDRHYRSGTEWEVPIMGYDPRDMLRGHYVEFTYDWPGLEDRAPQVLCILGEAPRIDRVFVPAAETACAHPLEADSTAVYGIDGLMRGRLYLDQNRALTVQEELRDSDQRAIVTIRQREDGSFTPISIRFRPLTSEERAERDVPGDERPVPAIMDTP